MIDTKHLRRFCTVPVHQYDVTPGDSSLYRNAVRIRIPRWPTQWQVTFTTTTTKTDVAKTVCVYRVQNVGDLFEIANQWTLL